MTIEVISYSVVETKRYKGKITETGSLTEFIKKDTGYVYPRLSELESFVAECKLAVIQMKGQKVGIRNDN